LLIFFFIFKALILKKKILMNFLEGTSGDRYTDNRRFGINIRYNLGISKKEVKKDFMGVEED